MFAMRIAAWLQADALRIRYEHEGRWGGGVQPRKGLARVGARGIMADNQASETEDMHTTRGRYYTGHSELYPARSHARQKSGGVSLFGLRYIGEEEMEARNAGGALRAENWSQLGVGLDGRRQTRLGLALRHLLNRAAAACTEQPFNLQPLGAVGRGCRADMLVNRCAHEVSLLAKPGGSVLGVPALSYNRHQTGYKYTANATNAVEL